MRRTLRSLLVLCSLATFAAFTASAVLALNGQRPPDAIESAIAGRAERMERRARVYDAPASTRQRDAVAQAPLMPGYPYLVALVAGGDPPRPWIARALALTASLFTGLLVLLVVWSETASWTLAGCAASFALFGQALAGSPPGAGRPETVAVLATLVGFAVLRHSVGVAGALLGALPLAAACFVDARAAWFVAAAALSLAVSDARRFAAFTVAAGALVGGGYVALSGLLGPWFNFEAWDAPLELLRFRPGAALRFTAGHVLGAFGFCTLVTVLSFAMTTRPWSGRRGIWLWLCAAAVAFGLTSTQSAQFAPAALIPATVALSMVGAMSLQRVTRHLSATMDLDPRGGENVALAALALQAVVLLALARDATWLHELLRAGLLGA